MKSITGKFVDLHQVNQVITNKISEVMFSRTKDMGMVEQAEIMAQVKILEAVRKEIMTADSMDNSLHLPSL